MDLRDSVKEMIRPGRRRILAKGATLLQLGPCAFERRMAARHCFSPQDRGARSRIPADSQAGAFDILRQRTL